MNADHRLFAVGRVLLVLAAAAACVLVFLGATGCAAVPPAPARPRLVALPSGQQGVEVRCGGAHRSFGDCMNAAALACGGAYQVVSRDDEPGATAAIPVGGSVVLAHVPQRSMIVACGA